MTSTLLVRRSLFNELGGFDKAMIVGEDTDLFFRLALKTEFCFVAEPLVKVDRSPSRSVSLKELFDRSDDKAFSSKERMYRKWLALPEFADPALRSRILGLLRGLYDDWMVRNIYQFNFLAMFEKMKLAKEIGVSCLEIFSTLVFRAGRRITRLRTQQDFMP